MYDEDTIDQPVTLPADLVKALDELSKKHGESTYDLVIAAVDHFTRIPELQRRAILQGTSIRRRG
ncbi:MAG: hypothetical protein V1792_28770 [Pseudomonadota bacterium]